MSPSGLVVSRQRSRGDSGSRARSEMGQCRVLGSNYRIFLLHHVANEHGIGGLIGHVLDKLLLGCSFRFAGSANRHRGGNSGQGEGSARHTEKGETSKSHREVTSCGCAKICKS